MSEASSSRQLVVFSLGSEEYALPITHVHEIIRYTEPRSVASPLDWIRGVISLRGKIVPVYDLAARLGIEHGPTDEAQAKIVIVETDTEMAGVVVDEVEEVLTIDDGQIDDVPVNGADSIDGIVKIDTPDGGAGDRLVVLLSPDSILASEGDLRRPAIRDIAPAAGDVAAEVAVAG